MEKEALSEIFIRKPNIDKYQGITVKKDTQIKYKNEYVEQSLENLVFKTKTKIKGDGFKSVCTTTINLEEGDVLLFEEEERGYIKPIEDFVKIDEAINDLECIK